MAKTMRTVAFRAQRAQVKWIRARAKALGLDRSELLRALVTAEMLRTEEEGRVEANVAEIERRLTTSHGAAELAEKVEVVLG